MTATAITPEGRTYFGEQVQFDLHALAPGTFEVVAPSRDEAVVVLLEGDLSWRGTRATRTSVFASPASALYLPPAATVEVTVHTPTEIALASSATDDLDVREDATPISVTPNDVVVHDRGRPPWHRLVHDIVADNVPAQRLIVGETFNASGQWSSFPPHKHDGRDGEPALEEIYSYRFDNPDGFGFQGLYEHGGAERAIFLRHGSVVGFASGFHPVCAAPGYRLCYLWVLAGRERRLAMYEDPAHRWLNDSAEGNPT